MSWCSHLVLVDAFLLFRLVYVPPPPPPPTPPRTPTPEPELTPIKPPKRHRPARQEAVDAMERNRAVVRYLMRVKREMRGKPRDDAHDEPEEPAEYVVEDEDDGEYIVENIVGEKFIDGTRHFIVKWLGYEETTLEPAAALDGCAAVEQFEDRYDPGFDEDLDD